MECNVRDLKEIPSNYQSVFQGYPCFNTVQSRVFDDALKTDNPLVVSAPTGSGKTVIFELAIIRLLMINQETGTIPNIKIIYICPITALCRERLIDWHKKFADYGIKCILITSDSDYIDARTMSYYNLIISTPEKWDVLTRRWRDNPKLVEAINLFMIDEVHLLNADARGSTLEVIVSRMKTAEALLMRTADKVKIRFIALSATIPNVEDIAEWIEPSGIAKYFKFSEDVRPVKLNKIVYGFNITNKTSFKFDLSLNYKLPNLIYKYSEGKPSLIFCSTRKSVELTTDHLVTNLQFRLSQEQKEILKEISGKVNDAKLKQFISHGIAFHHAGLAADNRNIIEMSFREGHLPILVTTSTLAMGVNLPAHLVIIKGTKRYDSKDGYKDYDEVSIFQMIGRAGRSQFDSSATALILTGTQDKIKYEQMIGCTQNIESNLHKHLTEHLNAEIVLRTITDLEVAMRWLSSTFLYVRARKCPEKYKLPAGLSKEKIDKKLLEICQIDLNKLVRAGMIKMNQAIEVAPTVVGEIMAKYYIAFDTMELFTKVSGDEIMIQILAIFSKCREFSDFYLRSNDKKCLNLLNKNAYKESNRFPLTGKIKTVDMKINCVIQAVLGNLEITDQSILNDSVRIMRNCERLAKCLIEYLETRSKCYNALLSTIILAKCFQVKMWENSPYVSKQLTGVGRVMSTLLAKAGKATFKEISKTNPRHIEMIIGRKAPFGNTLVEEASHLPEYEIALGKCNNDIILTITLSNAGAVEEKPTVNLNSMMILLIGDSDNNILLYEKYAHSYMLDHPKVTRSINIENPELNFVTANFISDDWVGIDCYFKLELSVKPLGGAIQNNETNQNKNTKQTFLEKYMPHVKKGNTDEKKSTKENTTKSKENQLKQNEATPIKAINVGISNRIEDHNKEHTDMNINLPENENQSLLDDNSRNNNNGLKSVLPPTNTECLRTSEAKHTPFKTIIKKSTNPKTKKIRVSNSIFRSCSQSKQGIKLDKRSKSKVANSQNISKIQDNIVLKNEASSKINKLQLQHNKISHEDSVTIKSSKTAYKHELNHINFENEKDKLLNEETPNGRKTCCSKKQTEVDKDKETIASSNISNIPCSRQNMVGIVPNNNTHHTNQISTKHNKKINTHDSDILEEFNFWEPTINKLMDDFEKNEDTLKGLEIKINKTNSETAANRNISLKNLNNKKTDNECHHGENNGKRSPIIMSSISCNKTNTKIKYPCFANDNENKNLPIKYNDKENDNKKFDNIVGKNNNALFSQEIYNSQRWAALLKKYSSKTQSLNDEEKEICQMKDERTKEDNRGRNAKTIMECPDSTVENRPFRREDFSTPHPKRSKGEGDYSYFDGFQPKSIKWRSPLIHSPPEKFSPHTKMFCFGDRGSDGKEDTKESNDLHLSTQDTSSSGTNLNSTENLQKNANPTFPIRATKKKLQFPLCDQEYMDKNESSSKDCKNLEDICDLEYFGLSNRHVTSHKDTTKNSLRSASIAGEYYTKLMGSQHKNDQKDTKEAEKFMLSDISFKSDNRNLSASFEAASQSKLFMSENKPQSPNRTVNSQGASPTGRTLHAYHCIKPTRTICDDQKISHQSYIKNCTIHDNTQPFSLRYSNDHYCNIENRNCGEDMNMLCQEIPMLRHPAYNDCLNNNFVDLSQKELSQRCLSAPHLNDNRSALQSSPYFSRPQPFCNEIMYQNNHMLSPPPDLLKRPCTVGFGYPQPRYANMHPYYREFHPSSIPDHNYTAKFINNNDPRVNHTYCSQMGKIVETCSGHCAHQSDEQSSHFMTRRGNENQEPLTNQVQQRSPYKRKFTYGEYDQHYRNNIFFEDVHYGKEYHDLPINESRSKFMPGQRSFQPIIANNQSQSENLLQEEFLHRSRKPEEFSGAKLSQIFSHTPKRQLIHNPSFNEPKDQKPILIKTPHPNSMMPPDCQRNLAQYNSFDERLDNIILPRNQGFTHSSSRNHHYNFPNNFTQPSHQPNDKEYVLNKFLFSNDANHTQDKSY